MSLALLFASEKAFHNAQDDFPFYVTDALYFDHCPEIESNFRKMPDYSNPIIQPVPLPGDLRIYYGNITSKDRYGKHLTYINAANVKQMKWPKQLSQKNKAIKAFLDFLPKDQKIILYWT